MREATVVGHSLGGTVATALSEVPGEYVKRLVIIDQAPDNGYENKGLPFTAELTFIPVLGPALWQVTPDFAIKDGLGVAFAPGYDVPDAFVDDFNRMTYTSYDESPGAEDDYMRRDPPRPAGCEGRNPAAGDLRRRRPDLRIEEGARGLREGARARRPRWSRAPDTRPNVEKPAQTAALVLDSPSPAASGTKCKRACRIGEASEPAPKLRTHVRFKDNTHRTADRRRRPADRLRHARRVRAGAREAPARLPVPSPPAPFAPRDPPRADRARGVAVRG